MSSDALLIETEILNRLHGACRAPVDFAACRDVGLLLGRLYDPARLTTLLTQIFNGHPDEAAAGLADGVARADMGERERDLALRVMNWRTDLPI